MAHWQKVYHTSMTLISLAVNEHFPEQASEARGWVSELIDQCQHFSDRRAEDCIQLTSPVTPS